MDIKIGRVTSDPLASEAKRKREEAKYPPLKKTGFQLLGCRVRETIGLYLHLNCSFYIFIAQL